MTDIEVQSIDRAKLLFLLDPGHGIDTRGKRSPGKKTPDDGKPGIVEYEFNRDIVNRIIRIASARGIQAVDLVVQQQAIPLKERVRRANEINETHRCAFISVHANAAGSGGWNDNVRGFRVFEPRKPRETPRETINLSMFIRNQIAESIPEWKYHREIKVAGFYVIKHTSMPAVLTENGFMTNREDCKILASDEGRERIAAAHVAAMVDFVEWSG